MTRKKASRTPAEKSSMRIDMAVREGLRRSVPVDDFAWIPRDPVRPVTDPVIAAERAALKAAEDRHAGAEVASHVMRWLGCKGSHCGLRSHREHLAYGSELLMAFGLKPDPLAKGVRNGSTGKPERAGFEEL